MLKLIVGFAVSIDRYIEGPHGEYDWIIYDKEQSKELAESWKRYSSIWRSRTGLFSNKFKTCG